MRTKVLLTAIVVLASSGVAPVRAADACGGRENGWLHMRVEAAQKRYKRGEAVVINAEVVRRLPSGEVPVEAAEVSVTLLVRGAFSFDKGITDADGETTLIIRSDRLRPGIVDAYGEAQTESLTSYHCVTPTHQDVVTRYDFIRLVGGRA